jgi:transcriptional regulator with GAF, ATPase, and Fis domain
MRCPGCQHENRPQATFCEACGTPLGANANGPPGPSYAEITNALSEALERETATSEILRVIASSPTDLQPVMDTVLQNAARVCDATDSHLCLFEGDSLRIVANHGERQSLSVAVGTLISSTPVSVAGRAICERRTIHIEDLEALPETEYPETRARIRRAQARSRTNLVVPLLREGAPLGAIVIRREVAQPFSATQVALLETFAAQAVIAIENVRLFTELQKKRALAEAHANVTEALQQQTATADILKVISSSPPNVQPVFEAIAESAARLTHALFGGTFLVADGMLSLAATHTPDDVADAFRRSYPIPLDANTLAPSRP